MKAAFARIAFLGLTAALLGTTGASAQMTRTGGAQGFGPRRPPVERALGAHGNEGRWWNNQNMVDKLKLTDDQRKGMDQIFYDHRAKLIDLQANLQKAELAMEPLMAADQPDQKAMESEIDKVVSARGDLERANARFLLDIRVKLTPDQWKQLRTMRGNGMSGPGNGPGPGARDGRDGRGPGGNGPGMQWRNRRDGQGGPPPPPPPSGGSQAPPTAPPQGGGQGDMQ